MKGQNFSFKTMGWFLSFVITFPSVLVIVGFVGCRLVLFVFLALQFLWNKTVVYFLTKDDLLKEYIKEITFGKEAGYILKGMTRRVNKVLEIVFDENRNDKGY